MRIEEAITILDEHSQWRKGTEIPMQSPIKIGMAIDLILNEVRIFHDIKKNGGIFAAIMEEVALIKSTQSLGDIQFEILATECCKVGPITNEKFCPNCGKKILNGLSK